MQYRYNLPQMEDEKNSSKKEKKYRLLDDESAKKRQKEAPSPEESTRNIGSTSYTSQFVKQFYWEPYKKTKNGSFIKPKSPNYQDAQSLTTYMLGSREIKSGPNTPSPAKLLPKEAEPATPSPTKPTRDVDQVDEMPQLTKQIPEEVKPVRSTPSPTKQLPEKV